MQTWFKRLLIVSVYAISMAWVESAVVVYLRVMIRRVVPYQADPLPISVGMGWIEVGREVATLLMLGTVGWLAGRTFRGRAGYALVAFGIWDIFYYIFLIPMSGWPISLLDWDVLFLIPLPWWGPVLAPVLISLLLILGGGLAAFSETLPQPKWPHAWAWALNLLGVGLALYTFMASAIQVLPMGGGSHPSGAAGHIQLAAVFIGIGADGRTDCRDGLAVARQPVNKQVTFVS